MDNQVGCLDKSGLLRELLDGIAAVTQDANFAVNVGDITGARTGVAETIVESDVAGVGAKLADIHRLFSFRTGHDRQIDLFVVQF